jgi:hypothetical protein
MGAHETIKTADRVSRFTKNPLFGTERCKRPENSAIRTEIREDNGDGAHSVARFDISFVMIVFAGLVALVESTEVPDE